MINVTYSSKYSNYHIYNLFNGISWSAILNNYLKVFELFKSVSPKRQISVIDTMHGDGKNLPLLKLAANIQGLELTHIALHDMVPISADEADAIYVCDIYDLAKHTTGVSKKQKYDLAISIFSGINCATPFKKDGLKKICQLSKKIANVSIHTITHPQHWETREGTGSTCVKASAEKIGLELPDGEYTLNEFYSIELDENDNTADMEHKLTYKHIQDINIRDVNGGLKANVFIDGSNNHISVFTTETLLRYGDVKFIDAGNNLTEIYDSDKEEAALNSVYADGQLFQLLVLD